MSDLPPETARGGRYLIGSAGQVTQVETPTAPPPFPEAPRDASGVRVDRITRANAEPPVVIAAGAEEDD